MRMWIEAVFRDLKERVWGLKLKKVPLSEPGRHDRLFAVLFLALLFLSAIRKRQSVEAGLLARRPTVETACAVADEYGFYCAQRLKWSLLKLVRDFRIPQLKLQTGDC